MNKRFPVLQESERCKKVFKRPPLKAWKRGTNMKELLCPSKLIPSSNEHQQNGFQRCGGSTCRLCPFAKETKEFQVNGRSRKIMQILNCQTRSGVYIIECMKCNLFYIGRTAESLETRFRGHKRDIDDKKSQKTLPLHFQKPGHNLQQHLKMFMFLRTNDWKRLPDMESEAIAVFKTQQPKGLNQRE